MLSTNKKFILYAYECIHPEVLGPQRTMYYGIDFPDELPDDTYIYSEEKAEELETPEVIIVLTGDMDNPFDFEDLLSLLQTRQIASKPEIDHIQSIYSGYPEDYELAVAEALEDKPAMEAGLLSALRDVVSQKIKDKKSAATSTDLKHSRQRLAELTPKFNESEKLVKKILTNGADKLEQSKVTVADAVRYIVAQFTQPGPENINEASIPTLFCLIKTTEENRAINIVPVETLKSNINAIKQILASDQAQKGIQEFEKIVLKKVTEILKPVLTDKPVIIGYTKDQATADKWKSTDVTALRKGDLPKEEIIANWKDYSNEQKTAIAYKLLPDLRAATEQNKKLYSYFITTFVKSQNPYETASYKFLEKYLPKTFPDNAYLNKLFSKEANISALNSVKGLIEELDFSIDESFQAKYLLLVLQLKDTMRDAWMKVLVKVFGSATSKRDVDKQLKDIKINKQTFAEAIGQAVKTAAQVRQQARVANNSSNATTLTEDKVASALANMTPEQIIDWVQKNKKKIKNPQNFSVQILNALGLTN